MTRWRAASYAAGGLLVLVLLVMLLGTTILPRLAAPFIGPPVVDCDGVDRDVCERAWHELATDSGSPGLAGVTHVWVTGTARDICPTVHVEWWGGLGRISMC